MILRKSKLQANPCIHVIGRCAVISLSSRVIFLFQTCLHCAHDSLSDYFAANRKGSVIDRLRHLLTDMLLRFVLADFMMARNSLDDSCYKIQTWT